MLDFIIAKMHDTKFLTMMLASVAAIATVITLAMPLLSPDTLGKRMKSVALEREKIRQRERERLAREKDKVVLRQSPKQYMQKWVERLNLTKWLAQEEAREKLVQAGYRGQAPYVAFLFFRMVTPVVLFLVALFYIFVVIELDQPATIKIGLCLAAAYGGMQVPYMFSEEPHRQAPGLDQARVSRRARSAADLLRVRHVGRSRVQEGQRGDRIAVDPARRGADADHRRAVVPAGPQIGLRQSRQAHRPRRREIGLHGAAAGRALRHAARADLARDGAGKPRHAHDGSGKEGRRAAAQAHRADDPVLPAGAVRGHSGTRRDPRHGDPGRTEHRQAADRS